MCKQMTGLMTVLLAFTVVCPAQAGDIEYTDAGADHLWSNPENWKDAGGPPTVASDGAAFKNQDTKVVIADGVDAVCKGFMLGMYGVTSEAEISGGTLTCNWMDVGRVNQKGGQGYLLVTGGQVNVNGGVGVPTQFKTAVDPEKIGVGHIDLFGGIISAGDFWLGNHQTEQAHKVGGIGTMDITEGTLIVNGDKTVAFQAWIDNGWITAYAGTGTVAMDFDVTNPGKTTVTAVNTGAPMIEKAGSPYPADGAVDVLLDTVLSWIADPSATQQFVYLLATPADPNAAPAYDLSRVALATDVVEGEGVYVPAALNEEGVLSPVELSYDTTYLWAVDQGIDGAQPYDPNVIQGDTWTFTTVPDPNAGE